jgi:ElaB/YqjD/DUF883 family membrane-anchored ribosome-binding protein
MDANNRESAADVSNASSSSTGTATRMKKTISHKAAEAKDTVNEFGRLAADRLDESRESAARALEKTSTSLHSGTDQFSDAGHYAADRLQATADYVRETDLEGIFEDLQNFVRRHPAQALAGAAILGFLVARRLSRAGR